MADKKDNKITLVLSDDGKTFVPTKLPFSITRSIKEGISQTLNPFAPADPREKYSVSVDLYLNPNVELYQEDGKKYAIASPKVLQNYNKNWNPGGISGAAAKAQAEGVKARNKTIEDSLNNLEQPKGKQSLTAENFLNNAVATPDTIKIKPTDYLPSTSVNSKGSVEFDPQGNASFLYMLPDPTGTGTEVAQPAVLLPGGMGYFYVKSLIDAAEEFEKTYSYKAQTGGPSVRNLKDELWRNRYMSDEDYRQATRPGLDNRFDPATSRAVEGMLNQVSVSNKKLLEQGNMEVLGWQDFLKQTYQDAVITGTSVAVPSEKSIRDTLKDVYRTYKNTEPSEQDFNDFTQKVLAAAKAAPTTTSEFKDPVTGTTTQMTQGGFSAQDVQDLAEEMTRGTPERKSYWALQQFGNAFNSAINANTGNRPNTLGEVLQ